jgi:DNA-directed RNA polymerase subunit beta
MAKHKFNELLKSNIRYSYQKIKDILDMPYLIELQRASFDRFLQTDTAPEQRTPMGLQGVFESVFPVKDYNGTCELNFLGYRLEKPKYDADECRERGMTFAAPVRIKVRLDQYDITEAEGEGQPQRVLRFSKEQEAYFGEIPLMTETGTFIVNGTERVIVNQLHRSPGIFFDHDKGRTHSSGKILYSARIIPARGSWLDFDFDHKDIIYVRIDRRRKMHVTVLLKALGYTEQDLLKYFYDFEEIRILSGRTFEKVINYDILKNQRASTALEIDGEVIVTKNQKYTDAVINRIRKARLRTLPLDEKDLPGRVAAEDVYDPKTGEVLLSCNEEITEGKIELLTDAGIDRFKTLFIDGINVGPYLRDTLKLDKTQNADEAMMEIYRKLRPGEPQSIDTVRTFFNNLFFNPDRYDLTKVGRLKLNYKFGFKDEETNILMAKDILATVKHLIALKDRRGTIDDIDHLGNRRVRSVGELVENQYRAGLLKMERAIREKMSLTQDMDALMPHDLINAKPVMATLKEFFGSSPLSQFMDQTNPLSEVTHKRRLSALGPGGLTRDRAGFEVRDVHPTHYGRICPIETPEGPNIGLISSLSSFARVNEYGFVETPYRVVKDGRVTDTILYLTATEEENYYIAQANSPIDEKGNFIDPYVTARLSGEFVRVKPSLINYMDVSPTQLVSVAAGLIPFLEHDDANRALMGSNMQRQAVPLIKPTAPLIGTGLEREVARDSGVTVVTQHPGIVESVDATRIVVRSEKDGMSDVPIIYNLMKFRRSNQNTCYNQKPIVRKGDRVKAGDIIADGPACHKGELSLGQNVLVAFMPWGGYNFEDSVIVSERLVAEDVFTSIHIEEFECVARDTKLGREEITRDIPNVGDEALRSLDESGIIAIGSQVKPGDILVGKITPKGETQLSPEEKLLRAIFGEKAAEVKDTSLRVPPGVEGVVIDAKVFSRKGVEKDKRSRIIEEESRSRLEKDKNDTVTIIRNGVYTRIAKLLDGYITTNKVSDDRGRVLISKGKKITDEVLEGIPKKHWKNIAVGTKKQNEIDMLLGWMNERIAEVQENFEERVGKLTKGDELPPGVIKTVKVYIAMKRKLSVGDKMAGRHGNKGVVSNVVPDEDMPYREDGRPVDIILNPLGVPSRMNVGQILEIHLGKAAAELGRKIGQIIDDRKLGPSGARAFLKSVYRDRQTLQIIEDADDASVMLFCEGLRQGIFFKSPVFDGAFETEIKNLMDKAGVDITGQEVLYDGRTGEPFDQPITVGQMYMMKLHHLVDDKIHARSIGPYSLVTQQPLGGKAQFGGQRLGEMEVWAIEAYGAAHTLQEFLTVKSDDIQGRTKMYESIVKGDQTLLPGIPESFNVLIKELQSLALNVQLLSDEHVPTGD